MSILALKHCVEPHERMVLFWRAQMSGWAGAQALHAEAGQAVAYKGMADCFVRTLREEGFQALFKVCGFVLHIPSTKWEPMVASAPPTPCLHTAQLAESSAVGLRACMLLRSPCFKRTTGSHCVRRRMWWQQRVGVWLSAPLHLLWQSTRHCWRQA